MTQLEPAPGSSIHFLLPLPPGMEPNDPELFGFWTYELRIGHAGTPGDLRWWSTASERFGAPLRVVGVQHPAPALACHAGRINIPPPAAPAVLSAITAAGSPFKFQQILPPLIGSVSVTSGTPSLIVATAPYATPVLNGTPLVAPFQLPHTSMWFLLYAQAVQADGATMRNILIAVEPGVFVTRTLDTIAPALAPYFATLVANSLKARNRIAVAAFHQAWIEAILASIHLPASSSLSVIAVELLPGGTGSLGGNQPGGPPPAPAATANAGFPFSRILRASPLTPVAPFC
jgi:hypothetical protein